METSVEDLRGIGQAVSVPATGGTEAKSVAAVTSIAKSSSQSVTPESRKDEAASSSFLKGILRRRLAEWKRGGKVLTVAMIRINNCENASVRFGEAVPSCWYKQLRGNYLRPYVRWTRLVNTTTVASWCCCPVREKLKPHLLLSEFSDIYRSVR